LESAHACRQSTWGKGRQAANCGPEKTPAWGKKEKNPEKASHQNAVLGALAGF